MNFGEEVYRIVTSFREFDVTVKAATSRSTTFIVKGPDRASMQKKVEDSFVKSKIPNNKITREKVGASSFPATVVNLTNDKIINNKVTNFKVTLISNLSSKNPRT